MDLSDPIVALRCIIDQTSLKKTQIIRDANIMMEGPLDHSSTGSPSERFMQLYINPFKLAILARFTSIGNRIVYEISQDAWANGIGVKLKGENVDEANETINNQLKEHFRELKLNETWELGTGFMREQGDSIIVDYYEGELAAKVGTTESGKNIQDFSYMEKPAPKDKQIVKIEAFSKQQYSIIRDDGRGNPVIFQVSIFLGVTAGVQLVNIHSSRVNWLRRSNVNKDFEAQPVLESCYNEVVIGTMILKAMGEVSFRWGYGHPVIMTKGLSEGAFTNFKELIGNPTREAWHVLPSEWIESFEMISNAAGTLDLPAMLDAVNKGVVIATSIPKPILEGDVHGVVQGGKVNVSSYYALLDKIHINLEPALWNFLMKNLFTRNLLAGYTFDFEWGLRYSMSAEEQVDFDVKDVGNDVTRLNYMTHNEIRKRKGLPPLQEVVDKDDPAITKYAKYIGNSISTITVIDKIALDNQIAMKKAQAGKSTTSFKTTVGNDGEGKGEGIGHGQGANAKIDDPTTKRSAKSKALSRSMAIKNTKLTISKAISDLYDREDTKSVAGTSKELEMSKDKFYQMRDQWKRQNDDDNNNN